MAGVNDPSFRFATNVFDTDGTDATYEISFAQGYIEKDYVFAISAIEDPETLLLSDHTPHTVVFPDDSEQFRVKVTPVPATGRKLVVYRQTDIEDLIVRFTTDKLLTERNLDLNSTQLLMAIQEIVDGLRNNNLIVEQQIGTVIDLNKIINEVYQTVMQLLASGGIVSVAPRVWFGEWSGDDVSSDGFLIPGADVEDAGFYDVYVDRLGAQPDTDYQIEIDEANLAESMIRFSSVQVEGTKWFAVLRGYAKPYTGPAPITANDLRLKVINADGGVYFADFATEYGLVRCTSDAGCLVTIRKIPDIGAPNEKLGTGSYFSFTQKGVGAVTIQGDADVIINVPAGCKAETRGVNTTITATCEFEGSNEWMLSGDLAKE